MKMVKSLILGTAVAFAATAGAQAADMPVKAKPVSYVKICPQYGPGFYYVPGTDICLKVGGLVFAEVGYHAAGAITTLAAALPATESELNWRSRGYVALDARTATPYGVLRSYILGGFQQRNNLSGGQFGANNYGVQADGFVQYAFIQFAGFTAGLANSFFDFGANYMTLSVAANPWTWTNLFAYTANFGNGFSATISLEDASNTRLGNAGAAAGTGVAHYVSPDIVGNLRLDQAWGSAQVMGAAHQSRFVFGNEWGWAFGAGVEFKLPMLGAGDTLKFTAVTSDGAAAFTGLDNTPNGAIGGVALGFVPGGGLATVVLDHNNALGGQTEATSFMVQFRHFWTPTVQSVGHAGYNEAYNFNAGGFGGVQVLQYGHSLRWSPVKDLTLSLDVLYTEIDVNNVENDRLATWFRVTRTF
jgi:hypothetical protein